MKDEIKKAKAGAPWNWPKWDSKSMPVTKEKIRGMSIDEVLMDEMTTIPNLSDTLKATDSGKFAKNRFDIFSPKPGMGVDVDGFLATLSPHDLDLITRKLAPSILALITPDITTLASVAVMDRETTLASRKAKEAMEEESKIQDELLMLYKDDGPMY